VHDRREVALGLIRQVLEQGDVDGQRAARGHRQGVSVRRRLRNKVGANVAAGTCLGFDDNRLAEACLQRRRKQSGKDVGGAAGWIRRDHPDRFGWKVLRGRERRGKSEGCSESRAQDGAHAKARGG